MKGQETLFPEEQYEYWECIGKEQPASIDSPRLVRDHVSATHIYQTCPTCKSEVGKMKTEVVGGRHIHYLDEWDRCEWCGQKLSWDWEEIECQPYHINMIKKRDAVVEKERSITYQQQKEKYHGKLLDGDITRDEYSLHLKILEAEIIGNYDAAERLKIELKRFEIAKLEKQQKMKEYELAKKKVIS